MTEQLLKYLEFTGRGLSLFAVAVILVGFAIAAGRYAWQFRQYGPERDFQQFKIQLGSALTFTSIEYLLELSQALRTLNITDLHVFELERLVRPTQQETLS